MNKKDTQIKKRERKAFIEGWKQALLYYHYIEAEGDLKIARPSDLFKAWVKGTHKNAFSVYARKRKNKEKQ